MDILLLEDDTILSEIIEEFLTSLGHSVVVSYDGLESLEIIESRKFDIFIFDVGVPNLNGFDLLEYLREVNINTPTIFITSLNSIRDLERGFRVGCSDFIKKPFELKELELRVDNIKKLYNISINSRYNLKDGYSYDFGEKSVIKDKKTLSLAQKEALILEYFIKNIGRVIGVDEIIANVWGFTDTPSDATIRTYIKRLRRVLPDGTIKTVKGLGYKFEI